MILFFNNNWYDVMSILVFQINIDTTNYERKDHVLLSYLAARPSLEPKSLQVLILFIYLFSVFLADRATHHHKRRGDAGNATFYWDGLSAKTHKQTSKANKKRTSRSVDVIVGRQELHKDGIYRYQILDIDNGL